MRETSSQLSATSFWKRGPPVSPNGDRLSRLCVVCVRERVSVCVFEGTTSCQLRAASFWKRDVPVSPMGDRRARLCVVCVCACVREKVSVCVFESATSCQLWATFFWEARRASFTTGRLAL